MQAAPLLEQLFRVFMIIEVRVARIDRTNLGAPGRLVGTDTFGTTVGIDDVNGVALSDRLVRALRLTCSAADTIIIDKIGHFSLLSSGTAGIFAGL